MDHDPLCLLPTSCEQYPDGHPRAKRFYCDDCEIDCECERLAVVRADERDQAADRVYSFCAHTKHQNSKLCIHDEIAAYVRGEQPDERT